MSLPVSPHNHRLDRIIGLIIL
uniref:Uncharacterized protein n=1 Tax=Arundo donax TaxID=35708 RepID=A0A0A9BSW7_ARUDO